MAAVIELRDSDEARRFVLQSLLCQRVTTVDAVGIALPLGWYLEMATVGEPLPPIGFVADAGRLASSADIPTRDRASREEQTSATNPLGAQLTRAYEDYVLGRIYADQSFERAATAVCHYSEERDQSRAVAFLIEQIRRRSGFGGVVFSAGVLKTLQREFPEVVLEEAIADLRDHGTLPLLVEQYTALADAIRNTGDLLGTEDVFELEHKTAIAQFGQRLALRQSLQAAELLREGMSHQPPPPLRRRHQVPTRIRDEDTYPVGGFTSIANRGSIESLLQSQLAYMDSPQQVEEVDLFDIKFLRDELLYYSRDDNRFFRARRQFVIAFDESLVAARRKLPGLPYQQMILLLGLLFAMQQQLTEWLDNDELTWHFLLPSSARGGKSSMDDEAELLRMLFSDELATQHAFVHSEQIDVPGFCRAAARRARTHCISVSLEDQPGEWSEFQLTRLTLTGNGPQIGFDVEDALEISAEEAPIERWRAALALLLSATL